MQTPPLLPSERKPFSRWWFLLWGFLAGLLVIALTGLVLLLARGTLRSLTSVETPKPEVDAQVELKVAADGCGVERGEVSGSTPVSALTWVIVDEDGYTVLERNAEGEFKYRYFAGGHYRVHVVAWYLDRYVPISDEVEIDC